MVYPIEVRIASLGDDLAVEFQYVIGGHAQTFYVVREALEEHFGLAAMSVTTIHLQSEMTGAFMAGWERIRNAAARSRKVPAIEPIALTSEDFRK